MNRVFLLGLFDTGLYVAHSLRGKGFEVTGFDYNRQNPGFYSRLLTPVECPHPLFEPIALLEKLQLEAEKLGVKPALIPSSELFVNFVSQYREQLDPYFKFIIPELPVMNAIMNKCSQFTLAESCGIKVPRYKVIRNHEDVSSFLMISPIGTKYIIKAHNQVLWKSRIKEKAFNAGDAEQFREVANRIISLGVEFVGQELVNGDCTNNYEYNALMMDGSIVSSVVIRKIRQHPYSYGAATCIETCHNDMIEELGKRFVLKNGLTGFSNTEFKLDIKSGEYFFIETNARIWQQIRLTEVLGQDFLMEYLSRILNFSYNPPARVFRIIRWDDIIADLMPIWREMKRSPRYLVKAVYGLMHTRSFGMLNFRDPKPMLYTLKLIK